MDIYQQTWVYSHVNKAKAPWGESDIYEMKVCPLTTRMRQNRDVWRRLGLEMTDSPLVLVDSIKLHIWYLSIQYSSFSNS